MKNSIIQYPYYDPKVQLGLFRPSKSVNPPPPASNIWSTFSVLCIMGSRFLTFQIKSSGKFSRNFLGLSPSTQEWILQNNSILGVFLLKSVLAHFGSPHSARSLAQTSFMETKSFIYSYNPPFHKMPSTHDILKLPFHTRRSFRSSTHLNSIS